jgi:hypothetical protein
MTLTLVIAALDLVVNIMGVLLDLARSHRRQSYEMSRMENELSAMRKQSFTGATGTNTPLRRS